MPTNNFESLRPLYDMPDRSGIGAGESSADRRPPITLERLLEMNHSAEAVHKRRIYDRNREAGEMTLASLCGDARGKVPNILETGTIRSIGATGGQVELYTPLLRDPRYPRLMELTHYAGSTRGIGKMPTGCGGLLGKGAQLEEERQGEGRRRKGQHVGVQAYIAHRIEHPDPVIQACLSAQRMSRLVEGTDKTVLAAVQDHELGTITPVGLFYADGSNPYTSSQVQFALDNQYYDPQDMYAGGTIPHIDNNSLPPEWKAYLGIYAAELAELHERIPNLALVNHDQNPQMFHISTNTRPFDTKFPGFGPNSVFKLRLPRYQDRTGRKRPIPAGVFGVVYQEAQYPITHFGEMDTVFIETESMDDSMKIGKQLNAQPWMEPWKATQGNNIYIAKSTDGVIIDADILKF